MFSRKYKDKYVSVKDIYRNVKTRFKKPVSYKRFYAIVSKFFEILFRDVIKRLDLVHLPNKMGYIYLDKKPHKRAFHYRIDINESNKKGEKVIYKVPILDDYYYKIVWVRPYRFKNCKMIPLTRVKNLIKNI
tara:strand:- start:1546 stop:1941 length:396 start_codon:yes stop_codon:yes gene_type:complete